VTKLPPIEITFRTEREGFFPYLRDPATLARPWVRPGTPGLEHRIGGIEKQDVTGNISYDPDNHDHMVRTRAEKVRRVAQEIPPTSNQRPGGPATSSSSAGRHVRRDHGRGRASADGREVRRLGPPRHLNPLPPDLGHILREYRKVLVPEITADSSCGCSAPNTWSTRSGSTGSAAYRSRPRKSTKPSTSFFGSKP